MTRFRRWSGVLLLLTALGLAAGCQAPYAERNSLQTGSGTRETSLEPKDIRKESDSAEYAKGSGTSVQPEEDSSSAHPDSGQGGDPGSGTAEVDLSDVTAMRLINHDTGWIGGDGWIAFSDDGGTEWEVQAHPSGTVRQIFALNGRVAWAVTENNDLYQTTDGGEEWRRIGRTPNTDFLHFISPQTGFSGPAKTEDGGKTWEVAEIPDTSGGAIEMREPNVGWKLQSLQPDIRGGLL